MRKTELSVVLEKIFEINRHPLTVADILAILEKKGIVPNKTTIYRQLEKMAEQRQIEHAHLEKRGLGYEKTRKHHHHLICNNCDKVEDLVIKNEEKVLKRLLSRKGFKAEEHHFEVMGLCASCAK